ncbi:hypothetical protein JQ634_03085 [Bradyrhizobium sp. AUGA SZCCT0240]|jgi:hypothetical protein|uniref:hypothetical protein n=1 Tax=unclassified Bradyrhizobium TaxID=2631580 RepID=UPI001BADDAB9|nr:MULTISPECIES: hypothetical protein [unclassified Bradyrhizobium]MBR1196788.1 hypothetical protein [Bradyrhizobium sp. AUGA SZCCT0158]MBR1241437.1 hypothetical protein [Bradyrhizobium sp. AUGA SZCCT0274]MBR1252681.1 hypothetical protein [Bradyrhizobium sp. AUGA SZCCT0240]
MRISVAIAAVLFGIARHGAIRRGEWSEIVEKGCLARHFAAFSWFNAPPKP